MLTHEGFLVPVIGVEPIRYRYHWILSPARLPIPSHRRWTLFIISHFFENASIISKKVIKNLFFSKIQTEACENNIFILIFSWGFAIMFLYRSYFETNGGKV